MSDHDLDPDAWEEQRRDADDHERDVLRRHIERGLAGDAQLEQRVRELGSSEEVDRG